MPKGFPITVTLTAQELSRVEAAPRQYKPHELTWIHRRAAAQGHVWTEEELRERGLPLYWSKAWVAEQLAQGHSHAEIAINAGGYQVMAVSRHVRHVHGFEFVQQLSPQEQQAIRQRIAEGATRTQVMQEFKLSEFGAGRYFQIEGALKELELRFIQEADRLRWPASREDVSRILFEGVKHRADNWATERIKRGWLLRVKPGVYDLGPQAPRLPAPGVEVHAPENEEL
ncbi:hypothetical protein ACI3L1_06825 [Deinococcus sp. SM5_A1]|uniref:hypothetical protein n=1 Tax=Deinococcus sp. SM5_A1 TaxID=3379094 RepID=UPI00385A43E9